MVAECSSISCLHRPMTACTVSQRRVREQPTDLQHLIGREARQPLHQQCCQAARQLRVRVGCKPHFAGGVQLSRHPHLLGSTVVRNGPVEAQQLAG